MSEAKDPLPAQPLELLHYFCQKGDLAGAMDTYGKSSGLLNKPGTSGNTALHWAAHGGHTQLVETLAFEGADVTVVNSVGDTPMHLAAWCGHAKVVEVLLRFHAKDSVKNKAGKYPSDLARAPDVKLVFNHSQVNRTSIVFQAEDEDSSDSD
jgi:hypothetical protein